MIPSADGTAPYEIAMGTIQVTLAACRQWLQHLPTCAKRKPKHFRRELGESVFDADGDFLYVTYVDVPVGNHNPDCDCGLTAFLAGLTPKGSK